MSWNFIAYLVAGLVVVFYAAPKVLWLTARFVHRYTRHSGSGSLDAAKD